MDYRRTYVRDLFNLAPGTAVSAYGWVKTRRDGKGISFVQLNDGSCFQDLQVVIDDGTVPEAILKQLTTGACVRIDGEIVESPAAGQAVELKASGAELYGSSDPLKYPLQKKGASFEKLAAERSTDTGSKARGGDLDWGPAERYVPPFRDALTKLKKGQMTDTPVQTQFGWHVIRVDDERAMKFPSLEEVKPQITQGLQRQQIEKMITELRAKAKVE